MFNLKLLISLSEICKWAILGILIFLIVFVIVYGLISIYARKVSIKNRTKNISNNCITIDFVKDSVLIFDKKHLYGKRKSYNVQGFYNLFDSYSRKLLEEFLLKKINGSNDKTDFIELNGLINAKKTKYIFSVLEITNINYERKIMHISQYFFENLPLIHYHDLKKQNKINSCYNVAENVIQAKFENTANHRGVSLLFRVKFIKHIKSSDIDIFVYYTFKNIIIKHLKAGRIFTCLNDHSFVLHDFKITRRVSTLKIISKIKHEFLQFLELNLFKEKIKFKIAAVEHKYFPKDYAKTMKSLKETIIESENKEKIYTFYDNKTKSDFYFDSSYKSEVNSIIFNHSLRYYFTPIINTSTCNIIGYLSNVVPVSGVFNDIIEVKNYAYKLNVDKELFSEISKFLINKFLNECPENKEDVHLFYDLRFNELEFANSLLGYVNGFKRIHSVLCFDEIDLLRNINNENSYVESLKKLNLKGYKIGLNIKLKNLELPDEIYNIFDYFIFDSKYFRETYEDISNSSLPLKKSIEKVLKYKKKTVLKSVNTLMELEVRIQENLKLLSGDAISPNSEMILPINKKVVEKIKRIKKKGN